MAHKDYVSRGKAKQSPPPKPPVPWMRIIITLALIIGFATFLWFIKDNAPEPAPGSTQSTDRRQQPEPLPEPPEEEWEFIETLPNRTVEVETPEIETSDVPWLMQCASFKQRPQAEEMRAKIAFAGLEAQIRATNGSNGLWYRVILGPYESKRNAERDRHRLQDVNINTCQIWHWNLD
ncbi:hypothetical protein HMF8227_00177 [Saliniradius amylolyticus]|uniref:SPOR domain-containing protein n=1 Tax=Saliniradius amylolyticus TaxID=2183582 RepID=A0A2S2DZ50_9ALTE|nr:SPOR domain-containing protein [Saliniradius amylolyticus]AWL10685.1 hypothetical protein HMF8227_00177 [Saliniradius amylolyticus]